MLRAMKTQEEKARIRSRAWRLANPERAKKAKQEYYSKPENQERRRVYDQRYHREHRIEHLIRGQEWRKANPEKVRAISARQRLKAGYGEWARNYRKKYVAENREKIREGFRSNYKKNWSSNPRYRLPRILRQRIRSAIKHENRNTSSTHLLGCSIQDYKKYLEGLFQRGMSWDNHGSKGWHIDHTIPLARFDLTKASQQKIAFNFGNTTPMWGEENQRKGDRIKTLIDQL